MNNLFNLARNGLGVAQAAIRVTGDNLTNGMSANYSRRSLIIGELGGMSTGQGFFGYGARASGVERAYDAFANNQLRDSLSSYSSHNERLKQLSDIDNMLADEADNVSVSLGKLFKDMATLSGDPADGPARAAVFTSLDVLANRYNASAKRISGLEKSTNSQIESSAKDINSFTEQLAQLNKQLERAQGNGAPPADLLDQRDALLEGLRRPDFGSCERHARRWTPARFRGYRVQVANFAVGCRSQQGDCVICGCERQSVPIG